VIEDGSGKLNRRGGVGEYLYAQRIELEEKNKQRAKEFEKDLLRECTFKPVIHSRDTYRVAQLIKKRKEMVASQKEEIEEEAIIYAEVSEVSATLRRSSHKSVSIAMKKETKETK
jgi:hypothetical protein